MANITQAWLTTFHRVHDQLGALVNGTRGPYDRSFIDEYHYELDRLQNLDEDVEDFCIRESDWEANRFTPMWGGGGIGTYNFGPLRGDEEMVVPQFRFERRFWPAYRFVRRRIQEEEAKLAQRVKPSAVLEERQEVLATLVDAYLRDRSVFHVMGYDGANHIHHPGLSGTYTPEWSHVEALAAEGLLDLHTGKPHSTWTIGIPNSVLRDVERGASEEMEEPSGEPRIGALARSSVIVNYISGGTQNIAQASSNVSQSITLGVQPGDRQSLRSALRSLGLNDEDLGELDVALAADEADAGERTIGNRVRNWLGGIANKAITQGVVTGLVAEMGEVPELIGNVNSTLQAYGG